MDRLEPLRRLVAPATTDSYDRHTVELEAEQWLAAGVWGSVFLESLLQDAQGTLGIQPSRDSELGSTIARLRQQRTLPHASEILDAGDAVRLARNSLVHPRTHTVSSTRMYAETIALHIGHILDLISPWFASAVPAASEAQEVFPVPRGRVFLSTITPHTRVQEIFLRDLRLNMRQLALEPVVVQLDEWDRKDPMAAVLRALSGCDACLCVGLERSHAYLLREREGGARMKEWSHGYYTSGWLNLEAGAAFALGKPVVNLCESHIISDGTFDRDWNSSPVYVIEAQPPAVGDPAVLRALERLAGIVRELPAR